MDLGLQVREAVRFARVLSVLEEANELFAREDLNSSAGIFIDSLAELLSFWPEFVQLSARSDSRTGVLQAGRTQRVQATSEGFMRLKPSLA